LLSPTHHQSDKSSYGWIYLNGTKLLDESENEDLLGSHVFAVVTRDTGDKHSFRVQSAEQVQAWLELLKLMSEMEREGKMEVVTPFAFLFGAIVTPITFFVRYNTHYDIRSHFPLLFLIAVACHVCALVVRSSCK
jgi:hypothetical protein